MVARTADIMGAEQIANGSELCLNQPHSEVAALAVFLDSWLGPLDSKSMFEGAQIKVLPSPRGKVVINDDEE